MAHASNCPEIAVWRQLLAGQTSDAELTALESHLNECARCVDILEALAEGTAGPALPLEKLREPPPLVEPALKLVIQEVSKRR